MPCAAVGLAVSRVLAAPGNTLKQGRESGNVPIIFIFFLFFFCFFFVSSRDPGLVWGNCAAADETPAQSEMFVE